MDKKIKRIGKTTIVCLVLLLGINGPRKLEAANKPQHSTMYQDYALVLATYVDTQGMVNYAALKANRQPLDAAIERLSTVEKEQYQTWKEQRQIAFWINAYNAITLKVIIDHYPIKPNWKTRMIYPNGIRQIPGAWTKFKTPILDQILSLDAIEHKVLRKNFSQPYIHMALVCAAMSCPPLRNEPYIAQHLDYQFKDQTDKFLGNVSNFIIEKDKSKLYLSKIFEWFAGDFKKVYAEGPASKGYKGKDLGVINFISQHLEPIDAKYITAIPRAIEHLKYNWSLNEQKGTDDE